MALKIAVTGEIRSGKDTFTKVVMDNVPSVQKLYFAEGIERVIKLCFPEELEKGKPRKLYQDIGTYMRGINPEVWINYTEREMLFYRNVLGCDDFIVTDLRQENEVKWLKDNGFVIVKVVADEATRIERMKAAGDVFSPESLNHVTEIGIRNIEPDFSITNNGTEESFIKRSKQLLKVIEGAGLCN